MYTKTIINCLTAKSLVDERNLIGRKNDSKGIKD